jgi:hypothetical protein
VGGIVTKAVYYVSYAHQQLHAHAPTCTLPFRHVSSWSSLQHAPDDSDGEDASSPNAIDIAAIDPYGGHITLNFGQEQSTFHASWLRSNDPKNVMLPSGQRKFTPGQYTICGRPKIEDATIVYCNVETDADEGRLDRVRVNVPGPTPEDCCHPLSIYGKHPPWIAASVSPKNNSANLRPYLQINWTATHNDDKASYFDVEWLQRFRYDNAARRNHRNKTEVRPIHAIRRSGPPLIYSQASAKSQDGSGCNRDAENVSSMHEKDGLVHVNYHSLINPTGATLQKGLLNLMNAIFQDGAAIVSNTPQPQSIQSQDEDDYPVAKIAKSLSGGSLSHGSLYGQLFHVRIGERQSTNVAYTSHPLCPHQDLAYYESPPGIQLLHCVAMGKGVKGGESTLVDALAAAWRLRQLKPESFECLVKCPATFVKQRDGACMTYRRPHIVLAEEGYGKDCTRSYDREILAVHWSPPFEGPVLLPPEDVDRYCEAYADFERMLDNSFGFDEKSDELVQYANEYTWERRLEPGEVLIFNNRR